MLPNAVHAVNLRHAWVLLPELVLTAWGLVLVLADLSWLRNRPLDARRRLIGVLSLVGVGLGLVASLIPIMVRFDLYGAQASLNFAGLDLLSEPDPVIFFGTISADFLTEMFNVIYVILLGLVVRTSMAWSFTEEWGEYFALLFWATVGMMVLTAAEDLITLFVSLELMTICLYLLTAFEKTRRRSPEGGLKYFVYGSVSSALFLYGLSLVYGLTGTTHFDAMRAILEGPQSSFPGLAGNLAAATAVLLLLVGFGFKVGAVPFHQWVPDAYEGAPAGATAWISTGSKMASFVALMKVFGHALVPLSTATNNLHAPGWLGIVAVVAAVTMTYGNLAALAQRNLKRMLAYSSIANAGYMLVGVAAIGVAGSRAEAAGSVLFYLIVYSFANIGAFAVAAWLVRDKDTDEIDDLNGLGASFPGMAACITILMLSLIGIPPLAGFFGKVAMFMKALDQADHGSRIILVWLVGLGLLNSVISAFYYVRVLKAMYLRNSGGTPLAPAGSAVSLPIVLGTAVVIAFGVLPDGLMDAMKSAAVSMLSSSGVKVASSPIDRRPAPPLAIARSEQPVPNQSTPPVHHRGGNEARQD
jgi:NADH-quinone oxidoreductase subunit N